MTESSSLGFLINESLYAPRPSATCDCPGERPLEMLDEPPVFDRFWHVCPCCGTRKLLPETKE